MWIKVIDESDGSCRLSNDNDWEETEYQLQLRRKLEQAELDILEGRVFNTEEARAYLKICGSK